MRTLLQLWLAVGLAFIASVTTLPAWGAGADNSVTNAADLSIEQLANVEVALVFGASKYDQKVTQAPASISIVTADEIKKFGYRTVAEALRSVRGLYVSDDRNYSYLGVRGFLRPGDYNTRVLVLIDGHRMNDNIYDGAFLARENMIDIDLVERIEIIRGPSSSIYGSSAFFGVINIVTKRGSQIGGAEASAEAGSYDSYKGRFSYGEKFKNDLEVLLSGSYYLSEGPHHLYYPEFDQRISSNPLAANNGIAEDRDGEKALNIFSSATYRDFTLSGFFNYRIKEVPTGSYFTLFNIGREQTSDFRGYADLKYQHSFSEDLQVMGRVFYDVYDYYGVYPYDYAAPGDPPFHVLSKDNAKGRWVGTEWQLNQRFFDRHTLILGGEYRENLRQHQSNYDEDPYLRHLSDDRSSRNLGLYLQGELAILTNLLLNAGVRYDHYFDGFGDSFNPRVALIYNPWEGSAFKAMYGEAFRAPNAYERYYYSAQPSLPPLKPETIRTYELAYEQYFAHHYRAGVSAYHYRVDQLITQIETGGDIAFENIDEARATGIEFEFEAKFDSGLLARASYALQRAEDGAGRELTSSPRHLAKVNVIVPLYRDKIFAGVEVQYLSSMRTLGGHQADDFAIANLTLYSRELVKNLEMSAGVYNLFDTKYGYPGAEDHSQDVIRQNGRSFQVKLTYHF